EKFYPPLIDFSSLFLFHLLLFFLRSAFSIHATENKFFYLFHARRLFHLSTLESLLKYISLRMNQHYQFPQSHLFVIHVDRKSTRLNSSHVSISYAVFCLKKKKKTK